MHIIAQTPCSKFVQAIDLMKQSRSTNSATSAVKETRQHINPVLLVCCYPVCFPLSFHSAYYCLLAPTLFDDPVL